MRYKDKVYYSRLVVSTIGGMICGVLGWNVENVGLPIMLMTLTYLMSTIFSVRLLKSSKIGGVVENPLKIAFLEGIGTFIVSWLMMWIIVYNLLVLLPLR
ncbi:MAG: hypothetical protein QXH96_01080 [Candidatus Geothermarchaeota archaeon]